MDSNTLQRMFTEVFKLNSPDMLKKADSDTRRALSGLHTLVEDEKRGLTQTKWLEDMGWKYETAIALGLVKVAESVQHGWRKTSYLSSTDLGRKIHDLLVREGYDFAPPSKIYSLAEH